MLLPFEANLDGEKQQNLKLAEMSAKRLNENQPN
jgi:hypothetical protein